MPMYHCGLTLCCTYEFKLETVQTTSREVLFYRSLEEFGLFSFRKTKAERSSCYLN